MKNFRNFFSFSALAIPAIALSTLALTATHTQAGEVLVNGVRIAPDSHNCFHLSNIGADAFVEITIYDQDGNEYTGKPESWGVNHHPSNHHPSEWQAAIPHNATRVFCSQKISTHIYGYAKIKATTIDGDSPTSILGTLTTRGGQSLIDGGNQF